MRYPSSEEELNQICKNFNLSKRKSFLNFDANQYYINCKLMDLRLVDKEITDEHSLILKYLKSTIDLFLGDNFVADLQLKEIKKILDYLEIKTFDYFQFYTRIKYLKQFAI